MQNTLRGQWFIVMVISVVTVMHIIEWLPRNAVANHRPAQITEDVSPSAAEKLIAANRDNAQFVVLDVRTPKEFAAGHLANAVLLDFYARTFAEELAKLDKTKTYLVYCRIGGRSGKTLKLMDQLQFTKVYNMLGGLEQWQAERWPVVK